MTRCRFTIRELFLLTAIVGLVLGWWIDHSQFAAEVNQLDRTLFNLRKKAIADFINQNSRSATTVHPESTPPPDSRRF